MPPFNMWEFLSSNLFLGLIFLLIIVPLYAKLGLLNLLWNKNGKNGEAKEILRNHEERLDVANKEMGDVKISLARIEVEVVNIKEGQERIEKAINNIYHKLDART